jgi:hypothetical protein
MKPGLDISQIPRLKVSQTTISDSRGNTRLLDPIGGVYGSHASLLSKSISSLVDDTSLEETRDFQAEEDRILAEDPSSKIHR